ncbi:unnamed protein product [Rhizophagus irregularis]|nr:unnamed protein product [Rhizophagus irregularis]
MTPSQLELWYRYLDIVVQDVTCKTNRYEMALSLFIILDENRNVRLIAQALLIDETKESHKWSFEQFNLTTNNVYPQVIITKADSTVHAAIRSTFPTTYLMHCTFHISQNLIKKVQKLLGNKFQEFFTKFHAQYLINTLYNTKESWTHPWTCHQFTAGLHASSPVESINAWIKSYIFNSNISLCELGDISTTAFMFTFINQKLEEYLPPAILELQRDEICQYLEDVSNVRQITAACMISNINKDQISSINKDPSKEQFLVASKFENEITPFIPQYNVLFLTAICKTSQEFITQHEQLTDI